MKLKNLIIVFSLLPAIGFAQTTWKPAVILVNQGKMYVDSIPTTLGGMYVSGSAVMRDSSAITQDGATYITGNFVHDASSNVFTTSSGYGVGTGKIVFTGNNLSRERYISTDSANATYARTDKYITFPRIVINTNDMIRIPSRMGLDATSVKRNSGYSGRLKLTGDAFDEADYSTSLRVTGSGTSSNVVDAGTVIVERDLSLYIDSVSGNTPVIGFASPFKNTQIAGYFAANWVSSIDDADPNTTDTYFTNVDDVFTPGAAQYIRIRGEKTSYASAIANGALPTVTGQDLNKTLTKLTFDGKVYSYASNTEQVFADDKITHTATTGNQVYGNSYTAPISLSKLGTAMTTNGNFDGYIYLFPAGSSSFEPYNYLTPSLTPNTKALTEIPSLNIFMLNSTASTSLSITKDMLTHGKESNSMLKSAVRTRAVLANTGVISDQAAFKVTLATNPNIYDATSITAYSLASNATDSYDGKKFGYDVFGLYTLATDSTRMAADVVQDVKTPVAMNFQVRTTATNFLINLTSFKQVNAEGLWLEDKQTGAITQMAEGDQYAFTASPSDAVDRFIVYFYSTSNINNYSALAPITAYCKDNSLRVVNLNEVDADAKLFVLDMQGRMLIHSSVTDIPTQDINVSNLSTGVYILHIEGKRNATVKFIKK